MKFLSNSTQTVKCLSTAHKTISMTALAADQPKSFSQERYDNSDMAVISAPHHQEQVCREKTCGKTASLAQYVTRSILKAVPITVRERSAYGRRVA